MSLCGQIVHINFNYFFETTNSALKLKLVMNVYIATGYFSFSIYL